MDLAHPDRLPQGLIGFYERWFRAKFPDAAAYERVRPVLEVCVAANRPIPEHRLREILGWSVPEQARVLEALGSLFERRENGVTPFHKSLRDWLTDDRSAGPDFMLDVTKGSQRLIGSLMPVFSAWAERPRFEQFDWFCLEVLAAQITLRDTDQATRCRFVEELSNPQFVHRLMLIDTNADEDQRQGARHWYRAYGDKLARDWPADSDTSCLWKTAQVLTELGWRHATIDWETDFKWWSGVRHWDDMDQSKGPSPAIQRALNLYREWLEGVLLLTTAVNTAGDLASTRPELAVNLPKVVDAKLSEFLETDAEKMIKYLYGAGEYHLLARNVSFLHYAVSEAYAKVQDDNR